MKREEEITDNFSSNLFQSNPMNCLIFWSILSQIGENIQFLHFHLVCSSDPEVSIHNKENWWHFALPPLVVSPHKTKRNRLTRRFNLYGKLEDEAALRRVWEMNPQNLCDIELSLASLILRKRLWFLSLVSVQLINMASHKMKQFAKIKFRVWHLAS